MLGLGLPSSTKALVAAAQKNKSDCLKQEKNKQKNGTPYIFAPFSGTLVLSAMVLELLLEIHIQSLYSYYTITIQSLYSHCFAAFSGQYTVTPLPVQRCS